MKVELYTVILLLILAVAIGGIVGYGVSYQENFEGGQRYRCREYVDMSKYMLKTECPPMPDMREYIHRSKIPKCPPCVCSCRKPCNIGKCPPCPRPRCPPPRKCNCAPCAPCPQVAPMRCPEPEVVIKEVYKGEGELGGPRPALSPIYGIYGNYK